VKVQPDDDIFAAFRERRPPDFKKLRQQTVG
jgi:hypothetical protein